LSEKVFDDCCDFCQLVDDSKAEVEPCDKMTQRCKGDTCAICPPCKRFIAVVGFTEARKLAKTRRRPKDAPKAGKTPQEEDFDGIL